MKPWNCASYARSSWLRNSRASRAPPRPWQSVTQPAVSQQIAALEHDLGVSLFSCRGRRIGLTDAGRHLYRYSRQALGLLDQARSEIGAVTDTISGFVRIASCSVPPETFLPPLLAAFHKAYPKVRETVSDSDTTEVTRAVEKGTADLGLVVVPPQGTRLRSQAISLSRTGVGRFTRSPPCRVSDGGRGGTCRQALRNA